MTLSLPKTLIHFLSGAFLLLFFLPPPLSAQEIKGRVADSNSKEGVPFASVYTYYNNEKIGTACDVNGHFSFQLPPRLFKLDTLTLFISSVGYETLKVQKDKNRDTHWGTLWLHESSETLDVVVVTPKKRKYSKKNNPAVDLIERAIARKDSNRIGAFPNYSYTSYEKILISQTGIEKGKKYWGVPKQKAELWQDSSLLSMTRTMPLSLREKQWVSAARNGKMLNPLIIGRRMVGVEEAIDEGNITANIDEMFREIDIYANNIRILGSEIPSPMNAKWATTFYKFFISDTTLYQETPCFMLQFLPMNARDAGFQGYVWIDTTNLSLRHVEMELPQMSNVNWVDKMQLVFEFDLVTTPQGVFCLPSRQTISSILKPGFFFKSGIEIDIHRSYYAYLFGEEALRSEVLDPRLQLPPALREEAMIIRPGNFGIVTRPELLTNKEQKAVDFIDYLKNNFTYKLLSQTSRFFATGYLPIPFQSLKRRQTLFDLGPYETMLGFHEIEGERLRIGGVTTANLMQHWFFEGYVSYGFRDQKWKYYTRLSYTPLKRDYHIWEEPRDNWSMVVQKDFFVIGDESSGMFKDGALSFWGNWNNRLCYYGDKVSLSYEKDLSSSVRFLAWVEYFRKQSAGDLHYYIYDNQLNAIEIPTIEENQLGVSLTWTPEGRTFSSRRSSGGVQSARSLYRPQISFHCSYFPEFFMENRYSYVQTALSYSQRIYLSMFGRVDATVQALASFGNSPHTSLFSPRTNRSWLSRSYSFETLRPLEFIADRALHFQAIYQPNGLILNRIPLINRLGLREVIGIEGFWGHMSNKARQPRLGLEVFSHTATSMMNNHLVWEGRVGINNIFKILGVDYIYRFSDRHLPLDQRQAIRIMLKMSF